MAEACISTSRLPIQCPVCLDTFDRPRTLPCLHTFCTSCLNSHITNTAQSSSFSSFLCPVCRANTRAPKPYSSRVTWAEQFPVNHWILSVIDEASSTKTEDSIYCDNHTDMKVNLYCSDHEVVCCAMCVATSHRKCDNVEEIASLADSFNSGQVQTETLEKVKQSEEVLTDLDAKCALADSSIQIDKDKMIQTIETEYQGAIAHLDALKQNAVQNVEQTCKQITNDIMTRKIVCNKGRQTCKQVRDMLQYKDRNKTPFSLFIQIHAAKLKMKSVDLCVANHWSFNEANSFTFEADQQFTKIKSILSIGKVNDKRKNVKRASDPLVEAGKRTLNTSSREIQTTPEIRQTSGDTGHKMPVSASRSATSGIPSNVTMSINGCTEIQYIFYNNNPLFKKHWISGLTFLHHGLLVLCNQSVNNLSLIKDNNVLYVDKRVTTPWDVSKYSENSVVVTYPQENTVRVFEIKCNVAVMRLFKRPSIIGRPVIFQRSFSTQEACFGVVTVRDRIILACEDCIKVYTVNGRCVQLLKLSCRVEPLFERVVGLSFDHRRSILYAADEIRNSLLSFKLMDNRISQQPCFVYKDPRLHCPRDLSVGFNGDIYVCGFVSKTVHIINSEGSCVRVLTTEQRPCAITVEHKQSIMAVSFYPESDRRHQESSYDVQFYKLKGKF